MLTASLGDGERTCKDGRVSAPGVRHPIFARVFDHLSRLMDREVGHHREELLAGLSGRVIEVGAGNGINFARYPTSVCAVLAVEPEPYLRERARRAADRAAMQIDVRDGLADSLPAPDSSFDAAIASLVLCSVCSPSAALGELRRVLKAGGQLLFFEHIRSQRSRKARVQSAFDRSGVWPWFSGGCHCSRDTEAAIESAGFEIEHSRSFDLGPAWVVTNPHVMGMARAP